MKKGMKLRVPVQDAWVGRAGSLPPSTFSVDGAAGGGGGMAGRVLPGDSERGRGVLWQASRELNGGFFRRVNSAGFSRT